MINYEHRKQFCLCHVRLFSLSLCVSLSLFLFFRLFLSVFPHSTTISLIFTTPFVTTISNTILQWHIMLQFHTPDARKKVNFSFLLLTLYFQINCLQYKWRATIHHSILFNELTSSVHWKCSSRSLLPIFLFNVQSTNWPAVIFTFSKWLLFWKLKISNGFSENIWLYRVINYHTISIMNWFEPSGTSQIMFAFQLHGVSILIYKFFFCFICFFLLRSNYNVKFD